MYKNNKTDNRAFWLDKLTRGQSGQIARAHQFSRKSITFRPQIF